MNENRNQFSHIARSFSKNGCALVKQISISLLLWVALTFHSSAYAQESWDLAGDWNPPANPNGAWTYCDYDGGSSSNLTGGLFVNLTYFNNFTTFGGGAYFQPDGLPDGYLYMNTTASAECGIDPGQISLEANGGTPVARWTAPTSGLYDISVSIGGTMEFEGWGFGNNFARYAGLNINMIEQTATSFTDNVKSWTFSSLWLNAGGTVDAYVPYQGYAYGGDTQAIFHIDAVQTPLLTIIYTNNQTIVSWPSLVTGWTLQTNGDLSTTNWVNYTDTVVNNTVTNSPGTGSLFFRLTQP
jgi:hypothetical protein